MWNDREGRNTVRILLTDIKGLHGKKELCSNLMDFLPKNRREKAEKLIFEEDRLLSLCGSALMCTGLMLWGNCEKARDIKIGYQTYGRPFCIGLKGIDFSISHTGNIAGCAFSKKRTGFDIERFRDGIEKSRIVRWSRNESVGKYAGEGIQTESVRLPDGIITSWVFIKSGYTAFLCSQENVIIKKYWINANEILQILRSETEENHTGNDFPVFGTSR